MILWPHHQVGLQWTKGPPINAQLRQQSPHPIPAHSPAKAAGPTISLCQAHIWGKEAIFTRRQFPRPQQGRTKIHPRGMRSISVPCTSDRLLPALSSLASHQANLTEKTMELCKQFLDYMATQEDAILTYCASNMVPNQNLTVAWEDTCSWSERTT